SFHISFELPYDSTSLADHYALSVFQKLICPTERCAVDGTAINELPCLSGKTFSQFLRERFNSGLDGLLRSSRGTAQCQPGADYWSLVNQEALPEALNLRWPIYRTLFILRDGELFEALRQRDKALVQAENPPEAIEGLAAAPDEVELDRARVISR